MTKKPLPDNLEISPAPDNSSVRTTFHGDTATSIVLSVNQENNSPVVTTAYKTAGRLKIAAQRFKAPFRTALGRIFKLDINPHP